MATVHAGGVHHADHDWEQIAARILMTLWGGALAISGVLFLMNATSEGADTTSVVGLGLSFLVASVPVLIAWRAELLGGRLLVVAGIFLAVTVGVIQYIGIGNGVMRSGAGEVNPWWVYAIGDILFGLPAVISGLLLLDHLRRREHVS